MSLSFRIMYRLGITPWEHADPPPTLIAMIEGPSALPKGSVLDVGCGTGGDAIYCATHGWDVTGVDASPVALRKANAKAGKVHADIRFVRADITRPGDGDLGSGHTFVLDGGCLHGLPPADLQTAITRINDATTAGATMLMFAFSPGPTTIAAPRAVRRGRPVGFPGLGSCLQPAGGRRRALRPGPHRRPILARPGQALTRPIAGSPGSRRRPRQPLGGCAPWRPHRRTATSAGTRSPCR